MNGIKEIPLESIKHRFQSFHSPDTEGSAIVFSHFGNFTESKINAVIKITEESILEQGYKRQIMRRVCSLIVESLQNCFNHSSKDQDGLSHSFFKLESDENSFFLTTGNLIKATEMVDLNQKLEKINRLNENNLRKLYIETLCNDNFNQKGGAGLGFLTMAKKIHGSIGYTLSNVNSSLAYFTLSLRVEKD